MLSLIAIAFLFKGYGTEAVPLPAPTSTSSPFDTPIFARDNPSDGCHSRTVFDILWSCLATTFACTWVSVHPNVPWRNEGMWSLLGRRIYLMFFSILAPEFMIVWAFKQWRGAVMIREAVNEASRKAFPDEQDPRRKSWTTTHGHLLQMGGFRISCTPRESKLHNSWPIRSQQNQRFYRRETSEGTWTTDPFSKYLCYNDDDTIWEGALSFDFLQQLLTDNLIHFPTITEDEINDRSKGDALSKGIALLQLTWFIVQIISRAGQGLVITELELTTAALAGLNSVMYIFWWSKPRDVRFPVVIRTKGVEELLAESTVHTTWDFSDREEFDFREHLWVSMTAPIKDGLSSLVSFLKRVVHVPSYLANAIRDLTCRLRSQLSRSYRYCVGIIGDLKGDKTMEPERTSGQESSDDPAVADPEPHSGKENMSRMQKICKACFLNGVLAVIYFLTFSFSALFYVIEVGLVSPIVQIMMSNEDYDSTLPMVFDAREQASVLFMMFYSEEVEPKSLFLTASIAGALFGGVHCLAWHFSFSSHAEQIMWRTASLGIVGACALSFVGTYMTEYIVDNDIDELDVLFILWIILLFLTIAVYPVFRLMLLVLAVTSLRSLPPSAFDTVQWIEFVPHI